MTIFCSTIYFKMDRFKSNYTTAICRSKKKQFDIIMNLIQYLVLLRIILSIQKLKYDFHQIISFKI